MPNTPTLQEILAGIQLTGNALTTLIGGIQNMPFRKQTREELAQLEKEAAQEVEFAKLEAREITDLQEHIKKMQAAIDALTPHLA